MFTSLLVLILSAHANETTSRDFSLENRGQEICVNSKPVSCYKTLLSLGLGFSESVERLYPAIEFYSAWLASSPGKFPDNESDLARMSGAILLERSVAASFVERYSQLDVTNLSAQIDPDKKSEKIPFALSVTWQMKDERKGLFNVLGFVQVVDGLLNLDLDEPEKFRDRFVGNIHITTLSGVLIPVDGAAEEVTPTVELLKNVVAPYLTGKFVSIARIGFNQIERDLNDKLQDEVDKMKRQREL